MERMRARLAAKQEKRDREKKLAPPPTAPDLDNGLWREAHNITAVMLDRSAVARLGGVLAPVDELYRSVATLAVDDLPKWKFAVPVYHHGIQLSNQYNTILSAEGVSYIHDDGVNEPRLEEMPRDAKSVCVSVRLWGHTAAPAGTTVQCNVGDFRQGHAGEEIKVRDPSVRDPVKNATSWCLGEGEAEYATDQPNVIPIRASLLAAQLTNPKLIEPTPELPDGKDYALVQPGLVLCRAGLIYPQCRGTSYERAVVVMVWDHHVLASALFTQPNQAGIFRFYSRAWGRYTVEDEKVVRHPQNKFLVVPYEAWDLFERITRVLLADQRCITLGNVALRIASPGFTEVKPASATVNCVATYCRFVSCNALLLRSPPKRLTGGWTYVSLARGRDEHNNAEEWQARVNDLGEKLNALSPDLRTRCAACPDEIDIDKIVLP